MANCLGIFLVLGFFGLSFQNPDESCPHDVSILEKQLDRLRFMEALEELDTISDELKHYKNPCERKKCLDIEDFKESHDHPLVYDYIVVGSGRGGCVMANRLSEIPQFKVAVLEQGSDPQSPVTKIPAFSSYAKFTKSAKTRCLEPQDNFALAMSHLPIFEGAQMGGTSNINTNIQNSGNPSDFSSEYFGCFNDVQKFFQKSEKAKFSGKIDAQYHNFDGPLATSHTGISDLGQAFIKCGMEQGFPEIDPSGNFGEGFSKIRSNSENGKRINHVEAFLDKILYRKNLDIFKEATVYKIVFEGQKAVGIRYLKGNKKYTMHAKKEVIITLSAIDTAKLLMVSGIGPKEQLQKHRIECVKDLQVGQNLYDKIVYVGLAFVANSSSTPRHLGDIINKDTIISYLEKNDGPLATPNLMEAVGYKKINSPVPNVEYRLRNAFWTTDKGQVDIKTIGMNWRFYKSWLKGLEGKRVFSVYVILKALSSGKVKLQSGEPLEEPEVCGHYFSNEVDKKNMIDAIKFLINFMKCESFKKFGIELYDVPIPNCEHSKNYWECAVKYLTVPYQDFSGTCKMGPSHDPSAVVDYEGRIHGIQGLRCVGRQVLPEPTFGGSTSFVTAMAERISNSIRESQGYKVKDYCPVKNKVRIL